jgi:glycosyltransferase involved in cell wall biosynthesis
MGSGTRLKLLEAMASGCAIVATNIAASGLLPEVKAAMHIADDENSFADAVAALLEDSAARARLGTSAREQVAAFYDWSVLIPRLLAVYKGLGVG